MLGFFCFVLFFAYSGIVSLVLCIISLVLANAYGSNSLIIFLRYSFVVNPSPQFVILTTTDLFFHPNNFPFFWTSKNIWPMGSGFFYLGKFLYVLPILLNKLIPSFCIALHRCFGICLSILLLKTSRFFLIFGNYK